MPFYLQPDMNNTALSLRKHLLLTCFGLLIASHTLLAQKSFEARMDSLITAKMEAYQIPGLAVGIVKDGSILQAKGYGVTNIETGNPVTENHVFHVASVSKLFTALAIAELVAEGKLKYSDKLVDIVSTLSYTDTRVEAITLKQMLNHTSGIPDIFDYDWDKAYKEDNSLRKYVENKKIRLLSDPGTNSRYSNLAYDMLGLVVEEASGELFEDYIKKKWLDPSGMKSSDFRYYLTPEGLRTSPHTLRRIGNRVVVRSDYPYNREHAPSSTLNASVTDLSRWMISFMDSLKNSSRKELYREMTIPSSTIDSRAGIGFQLWETVGYPSIGHFGGDQGFRSLLFMVPERETGFVLLVNCDYKDDIRQEVLRELAYWLLK